MKFLLKMFIFFILLFLFLIMLFKRSAVYKEALSKTKADAKVMKILGTPIKEGFLVTGSIKNPWSKGGRAWLTIPIYGPSARGTLHVNAVSDGEKWDMELEVKIEATGESIKVGEEPPPEEEAKEPEVEEQPAIKKDDITPPKVISTSPENGATNINPSTKEISVFFNEPMMDKSWSWSTKDPGKFPKVTGQPYYSDHFFKANLPVRLVANKRYEIWVNTYKHKNFKDRNGNPAIPYKFSFKTGR
ncbi:cytochrome c oxidase assembly factor Coa1 family protein [Candidatus Riflebacteria bacterium]